jgi:hypothetical protein
MGAGGPPPTGAGGDMGMPPMGGGGTPGEGNTKPTDVKTHNVWDVLKKYLHKLKSGNIQDDNESDQDESKNAQQ